MRTAGFVLVGGASTRMGRDKALLRTAEGRLIEPTAAKVRDAAGSVCLVGASERYRKLELNCIDDLRPGLGPLAGIEAALTASGAEWNLIIACDMPGVEKAWLVQLLEKAQHRAAVCLISEDPDGRLHPLCGVWHRGALAHVRRALDEKRLRMLDLVRELRAETVKSALPLVNVNTPEDWECWQLTR
jgi:molybdopterin-guanine dinucleotide biosynthesis protein A